MKTVKRGTGDWGLGTGDWEDFSTNLSKSRQNIPTNKGSRPCPFWAMFLASPLSLLLFPCYFFLFTSTAHALPGQSVETVVGWINAHPTLRPGVGDGLRVTKGDTPAQRFSFQATVLAPGRVTFPADRGTIRTERMSFYDMVNGVTPDRLKESLRVIYGPDVYQDYDRAKVVYEYPTPETVDLARRQNRPLEAAQQGELRLGERFAYWMEVTKTDRGKAFNGQMTVFLKEDLDKLETEIRDR